MTSTTTRSLTRPLCCAVAIAFGALAGARAHAAPLAPTPIPAVAAGDQSADELYRDARELIDGGHYDKAVEQFTRLATLAPARADAALYWKAYSLAKLGERADALTTLADLERRFADSRWLKDAKALEVEVRQASGQSVSPDSQNDEELKLLALRGLMQSDPDRGLPFIEKMLAGTSSTKVKEQALFVLSQSPSARAREIITGIAKGAGNPELQLRAIRYLGIMGGQDNRQILADVYNTSADPAVKHAILRSFMISGDRARLLALAKGEKDASLRGEAVQQLGVMGAQDELSQLYQTETSIDVRKRILQAMFVDGGSDRLIELAKTEKDPELRQTAVRNLGLMSASKTGDALRSIYASDASPEVRKAVIQALFVQNNATTLVALARAEKSAEMKKDIVQKLSLMKSKEATDYLLELLK